jgi:hypothetical protein
MRLKPLHTILILTIAAVVMITSLGCSVCRLLTGGGSTSARRVAAAVPATSTPQPTFTNTPLPTNTPIPTPTSTPTKTPVPTDTPVPTVTPVPTNTPKPTRRPAPAAAPKPAAPAEQPAAAPAPAAAAAPAASNKQFTGEITKWWSNCGVTMTKGKVVDKSGNPVNGLRLKMWTDGWDGAMSLVSGVGLTYGPGEWDLLLRQAQTGHFKLAVWDWQTGPNEFKRVDSQEVDLNFDYTGDNCKPDGGGHQVAEVTWTRQF